MKIPRKILLQGRILDEIQEQKIALLRAKAAEDMRRIDEQAALQKEKIEARLQERIAKVEAKTLELRQTQSPASSEST